MARVQLQYGAGAETKSLAEHVIAEQEAEIRQCRSGCSGAASSCRRSRIHDEGGGVTAATRYLLRACLQPVAASGYLPIYLTTALSLGLLNARGEVRRAGRFRRRSRQRRYQSQNRDPLSRRLWPTRSFSGDLFRLSAPNSLVGADRRLPRSGGRHTYIAG